MGWPVGIEKEGKTTASQTARWETESRRAKSRTDVTSGEFANCKTDSQVAWTIFISVAPRTRWNVLKYAVGNIMGVRQQHREGKTCEE